MNITAAQLRAARGLMDWTRSELAKVAGLSAETIKNIEHGVYMPQDTTINAIVSAFSKNDVEFTGNDGVRRNSETVVIYSGKIGFKEFMDDVYEEAKTLSITNRKNKPIFVSNVDDELFVKNLEDYAQKHVARMNKLKNVKVKVLTGRKNYYRVKDTNYIEYRWIGQTGNNIVPFYVYGDKFAVVVFKNNSNVKIVVIKSEIVANAYREQFKVLWNNSSKQVVS